MWRDDRFWARCARGLFLDEALDDDAVWAWQVRGMLPDDLPRDAVDRAIAASYVACLVEGELQRPGDVGDAPQVDELLAVLHSPDGDHRIPPLIATPRAATAAARFVPTRDPRFPAVASGLHTMLQQAPVPISGLWDLLPTGLDDLDVRLLWRDRLVEAQQPPVELIEPREGRLIVHTWRSGHLWDRLDRLEGRAWVCDPGTEVSEGLLTAPE
ncbi:MAG: hypothetical protein JJT89_06110 [Nitriliruptoraceae bacterium]|nr:hypothetical protein [Nitriliruptoraceae bacterium]